MIGVHDVLDHELFELKQLELDQIAGSITVASFGSGL